MRALTLSRSSIAALTVAATLSACSLTPRLVQPDLPVPNTFSTTTEADRHEHASRLGWQSMFGDPRLQRLIQLALDNNRDLRLATLNVAAAQAQFRVQRANQLPAIDANGTFTREHTPANTATNPPVPEATQDQYGVNVGVSAFELDLFGRARALSNAAFARYLATEQGRRAAQIALVGAVADAYFAERLADEQLQLAEHTLTDWQQSLELARRLKDASQNSGIDVAQAEGQVASAEADMQARHRALMQAGNALELLLGTTVPTDLPAAMPLDQQPVITQLPAGLPSELLTQRPDLLQAEQNLIAANADIGAARAAFLPRLSLTASMGYASPALSSLFDTEHRTWRFAPQITQPLFQGGRLRSELRLSHLRKSTAIVEYERAIQTAFREVADGLAGRTTYGPQVAAQRRVVSSAERRMALSNLRYRAGMEGRLELLDAQRQLYAAQQTLLELHREEFRSAVNLYKALGGGLSASDVYNR